MYIFTAKIYNTIMKLLLRSSWVLILLIAIISISCQNQNSEKKAETNDPDDGLVSHVVHPEWSKKANIYEVNLRQYTEDGSIRAFMREIPRLRNMGVDILWLMPIQPIGIKNRKGSLGSYYSVQNYTELNREFGYMDEFISMVDLAHQLGMHVIIDWVANHTAWDHAWVEEHPDWYAKDSTGNMFSPFDWSDVVQLDYDNPQLRETMIGELEFWIKETNIDGFRCDVAGMVPTEFWDAARTSLDKIKPVFMLAEAEKEELLINAFDMDYGWNFHHISNKIAKQEANANDLESYFTNLDTTFPAGAYRMNFTSNHDENSWNGTVHERYGDAYKTFAVLMATVPGMPLIYTGQEAALNKRLEFFEKDLVDWADYPLEKFYRTMLNLKKRNQALWNGDFGGRLVRIKTDQPESVFAFIREKDNYRVLVILNLSETLLKITLSDDTFTGEYSQPFGGENTWLADGTELELSPWEYMVFEQSAK